MGSQARGGGSGTSAEVLECAAEIEALSQKALVLQQEVSKTKQTVANLEGQLSELSVLPFPPCT